MKLQKICTEFAIFEADDPNGDLGSYLQENCDKYPQGPCNDESQAGGVDRDKGNNLRDLVTALAICNNVVPLYKDPQAEKALGDLHYNKVSKVSLVQGSIVGGMAGPEVSKINSKLVMRGADAFPDGRPQARSDNLPGGRASYMPGLISAAKGLEPPGYNLAPRASEQIARKRSYISGKDLNRGGPGLLAVNNDEIQFVEYAHTAAKYDLVQRDNEFVQIKNTLGFQENYDILADFPFKSNQRKQSILLKNRETGKVVYYAKGAEMVMESRVLES